MTRILVAKAKLSLPVLMIQWKTKMILGRQMVKTHLDVVQEPGMQLEEQ
jgi:hypothetical protein